MQIRVDNIRKNLALLQPVVPLKSSLTVLANVCLKEGKITASDVETTVSIDLPEVQKEAFLLPHKSVLELLKYVPGDEMLTLEYSAKSVSVEGVLKLSWNGGSASYEVPGVQDYPEINIRERESSGRLNGDKLIGALAAALHYCATDASRPVLGGVTLYLGTVLQIAAADGFRMSYESLKMEYPVQKTIIIPSGTISILEHLWRKEPAQVCPQNSLVAQLTSARQLQLSLWEGNLGMQFGNITLISKLVEGTPPDHLALLNNFQEPIKVRIMAPELYNAVRRLEGIARDSTGIVRLQWTESLMTVSAKNEERGEVEAEIPVEAGSNPGRIALNVKYLLEYLAGKDGLITLGSTNASSPALFHYGTKPIVAVMPMNVQWGDEPAVANEPRAESAAGEPETGGTNPEAGTEKTEPIGANPSEESVREEGGQAKEPRAASSTAKTRSPQSGTKKRNKGTRKKG